MRAGVQFDVSQFNRAINEIAARSSRTDAEIVTLNATMIAKAIAFNSPKRSGNMNAGWWAAWNGLNIAGTPNTRKRGPHTTEGGRQYIPLGGFVDNRTAAQPSIEMSNDSHAIINGKRLDYPFIVEARQGFMKKAEAEVAGKFQKVLASMYRKELAKNNG